MTVEEDSFISYFSDSCPSPSKVMSSFMRLPKVAVIRRRRVAWRLIKSGSVPDIDISYEMSIHKKRFEADFILKDTSINGQVWYMITENFDTYRIVMFYENLDNAANGDDL